MAEAWLPIAGTNGAYDVSDAGRVRSNARIVQRRNGGPKPVQERILLSSPNNHGYPHVDIMIDGKYRKVCVHTLVAAAFIGPRPAHLEVRHLDGDQTNAAKTNLAYGTAAENGADKVRHGKSSRGAKHHAAVLTERDVREIRRRYSDGEALQRELSEMYNVSRMTISDITRGRSWSWLDGA